MANPQLSYAAVLNKSGSAASATAGPTTEDAPPATGEPVASPTSKGTPPTNGKHSRRVSFSDDATPRGGMVKSPVAGSSTPELTSPVELCSTPVAATGGADEILNAEDPNQFTPADKSSKTRIASSSNGTDGSAFWTDKFVTPDTVASTPSPKRSLELEEDDHLDHISAEVEDVVTESAEERVGVKIDLDRGNTFGGGGAQNQDGEYLPAEQLNRKPSTCDHGVSDEEDDALQHVPSPGGRVNFVISSPGGPSPSRCVAQKGRNSGSSCSSGGSSGGNTACFAEDGDFMLAEHSSMMLNVSKQEPIPSPERMTATTSCATGTAPAVVTNKHTSAVHPRGICYDTASALVKTALALAIRHDGDLKKLGGSGDISVAVVDASGTLIAFGRDPSKKGTAMSATFAIEKAKSAVLFGCDTLLLKGVGAQQSSPVATVGSSPVTYLLSGGGVLVGSFGGVTTGAIGISSGTEFLDSKVQGDADDALAREVLAEVFGGGSSGMELFGLQRGRGFGGSSYDHVVPGSCGSGSGTSGPTNATVKKKKKAGKQPGSGGSSSLMERPLSEQMLTNTEDFPGRNPSSGVLNPPTHYGLAIPTSQGSFGGSGKFAGAPGPGSGGNGNTSSSKSTKKNKKFQSSSTSSGDSLITKIRADSETYYEYMQRRQRATTAMEVGPTMSSMLSVPPGLENEIMSAPPVAISLANVGATSAIDAHSLDHVVGGAHATHLDAISEGMNGYYSHNMLDTVDDEFDCATLAGLDENTPTNSACGGTPSHMYGHGAAGAGAGHYLQANVNISRAAFGGGQIGFPPNNMATLQSLNMVQKNNGGQQQNSTSKKHQKKTRNDSCGSSSSASCAAAAAYAQAHGMINPLAEATLLSADAEKAHAASVGVVTSGKHHVRTISIDGAVATTVAANVGLGGNGNGAGAPAMCTIRGQAAVVGGAVVGVGGTIITSSTGGEQQVSGSSLPVSGPGVSGPDAVEKRRISRKLSLDDALTEDKVGEQRPKEKNVAGAEQTPQTTSVRTLSLGNTLAGGGGTPGTASSAAVLGATTNTTTATATTGPPTASSSTAAAAVAPAASSPTATSPGVAVPSGARDHPVIKPHQRQEMLQNLQASQTSMLSNGIIPTHKMNKEAGVVGAGARRVPGLALPGGVPGVGKSNQHLELYQQIEGEIVLPGGGAPGGAGNNRGGVSKTFIFH